MPDPKKITALTEMTTLAVTDLFPVVDDPSGTPSTQKIAARNAVVDLAFGQISSNSFLADGGQVVANLASANLTAGSIGNFWDTTGDLLNVTADLPNGRLIPGITGIYDAWATLSVVCTPDGSVTAGGFRVKIRYNGADVQGCRTTVGFLGDVGTGDAARVLTTAICGTIDVTTAGQYITLAVEPVIIGVGDTATQLSFTVVDATLKIRRKYPT